MYFQNKKLRIQKNIANNSLNSIVDDEKLQKKVEFFL